MGKSYNGCRKIAPYSQRYEDDLTKRDTGQLEDCSLNDNSYLQIIHTTCITHCRTIVFNLFRFAFFIEQITTT